MTLDVARIKALCFDVDGTLSDTDDQMVASLARRLKWVMSQSRAEKLSRTLVMRMEGPGNFLFGLPDRFGIDDELADINERFFARRLRRGKRHFELIDGVTRMFTEMRAKLSSRRSYSAWGAWHASLSQPIRPTASVRICCLSTDRPSFKALSRPYPLGG